MLSPIIHDFEVYLAIAAIVVVPILILLVIWVIEGMHSAPDYKAWSAAYDEHLGLHAIEPVVVANVRAFNEGGLVPGTKIWAECGQGEAPPYQPDATVDDGNEPLTEALGRIDELHRANTELHGKLLAERALSGNVNAEAWQLTAWNVDLKRRLDNAERLIRRYRQAGAKPYRKAKG